MHSEHEQLLLEEIRQIRQLLELMAEPAIAQRDAKLRDALRGIVGASVKKQQSVLLMNGTRTQKHIITETAVHQGELSTLVSKLDAVGLLAGDKKHPKLALSIPANFFEEP